MQKKKLIASYSLCVCVLISIPKILAYSEEEKKNNY